MEWLGMAYGWQKKKEINICLIYFLNLAGIKKKILYWNSSKTWDVKKHK